MNQEIISLNHELQKLKSRSKKMSAFFFLCFAILGTLLIFNLKKSHSDKVIRVQGIIVEDSSGRERILIGTPIPFAENRARTDTSKIKETWAKRFDSRYMELYKDYAHDANGIVILDENGWDKIIVGDPAPDPIIGKRIGKSTGVIINDDQGLERTGYGILNVEGQNRVVLGLDSSNGTEGANLFVMPDGTVGLNLNATNESIFIGKAVKGNWNAPSDENFHGIIIRDEDERQKIITATEN